MPWTVLLLVVGSGAIPAPSILLVAPHPSSQEDPIHIACVAPWGFSGANFTLYQGGQVVQVLQAPAGQLGVTFNLSGGAGGATFHCQYGVLGEHGRPQLSDLSAPVRLTFPVKMHKLQRKRERDSCWAQISFRSSDMAFDNSLFSISMKASSDDDPGALDGPRKRPTSTSSSPEPPEFSTFRGCP
ncbi:protein HIDE1 isoform X2 [Ochotona princeps]|uniref:protein HIDE1 isoform X2 n=1 Tax=Ochotona princeps TaxID=9978 RepID=UPI002714DFAE|nr:protein HIDE1 isoform X2 [Ochotona princeps]